MTALSPARAGLRISAHAYPAPDARGFMLPPAPQAEIRTRPTSFRNFVPSSASIPLPEPKLEVEVVAARAQRVGRALLVLRDEGESVADAVLDGDDLVRLARHVCRVRECEVAVYLTTDREPRRRALPAATGDDGVELESVKSEKLVGRALHGRVNERVRQEARRRAESGLRDRGSAFGARREVARRDERDHVGLRQRRVGRGRRGESA